MDKNTITGLILILAIFIGFSIYNKARQNKAYEKIVVVADSLYEAGDLENAMAQYNLAARLKPGQPDVILKLNDLEQKLGYSQVEQISDSTISEEPAATESVAQSVPEKTDALQYGAFASSAEGENEFITLENNMLELRISLKGGRIYSARLKNYKTSGGNPLVLFDGDSTVFGFNFFTVDNKAVETNNLFFKPVSSKRNYVVTSEPQEVSLRLYTDAGGYIQYDYSLAPDKYMVDFNVSFKSLGGVVASNLSSLSIDWRMNILQKEKGRQSEISYTTIKYRHYQDEVDGFRERSNRELEEADIPTRLSWVAYKDQFFSAVLINNDFFQNGTITSTRVVEPSKYTKYFTSELGIPFNASSPEPVSMSFYLGPNHFTTLRKTGNELEQLVTLGRNITRWINQFVIIPIFNWLNRHIANYGIIILILTLIIKVVLFPLTYRSYKSQAKMQVLKPLVDELGKKFPKKEDAMKKQQATMDLYKRAGVNPMGGCLPLLLQMPILFAMFKFFPASIELRQQSFLWATDLSTYDSILTLPFTIPMYGNHVSLFTLLMTVSTILTMKMTGSSPGQDQPGMKMMTYMMPVMFMFILNNFSAALTYYYFLANILTFAQNMISKRFINAEAVLSTLEENKKKPARKSKWQQRLEAAARQRGINPPKR